MERGGGGWAVGFSGKQKVIEIEIRGAGRKHVRGQGDKLDGCSGYQTRETGRVR